MVQASVLRDDVYVYPHWTHIKIEGIICTSGAMHWIQDFYHDCPMQGKAHVTTKLSVEGSSLSSVNQASDKQKDRCH